MFCQWMHKAANLGSTQILCQGMVRIIFWRIVLVGFPWMIREFRHKEISCNSAL